MSEDPNDEKVQMEMVHEWEGEVGESVHAAVLAACSFALYHADFIALDSDRWYLKGVVEALRDLRRPHDPSWSFSLVAKWDPEGWDDAEAWG